MSSTTPLTTLLASITRSLDAFTEEEITPGLMNGGCGIALYYAYLYRFTGDEQHLERLGIIITRCIEALSLQTVGYSHCNGIAGIAWTLQHLINMGLMDPEEIEALLVDCDTVLGDYMEEALAAEKHDFLHEGLGIALYFLERLPHAGAEALLEKVVKTLEGTAVSTSQGLCWRDHFSTKTPGYEHRVCFNLGLAHGFPAIISVLSLINGKGIAQKQAARLIEEAVSCMQAARHTDTSDALYPIMIASDGQPVTGKTSRLGWCYGDLCIAQALLHAGHSLHQHHYLEEARAILMHVKQHRDKENGSIADAGLCHGAAGVAHIYRRAYLHAGDIFLHEEADKWLQETIAMSRYEDGIAGFKAYARSALHNSYQLLDGVAGIGLSLIAALDNRNLPAWDRCLLLS